MLDEEIAQREAVFSIGKVTSVQGRRVRVKVSKLKNSSHLLFQGDIVRNVAVGSYVKIAKGFAELVAVVEGERVDEDRSASQRYKRAVDPLNRELEVSLVGYLERGTLSEACVKCLYWIMNASFSVKMSFSQSTLSWRMHRLRSQSVLLATEPTQPVVVGVDSIFASHVGIFGNTGSGKSYTLAKLYHELFTLYGEQLWLCRQIPVCAHRL